MPHTWPVCPRPRTIRSISTISDDHITMKWIVVGAGSGGCVAARRLHDAGHDVVVIEAGPALRPHEVPRGIDGDDSFAALREPGRVYQDVNATRSIGQPERPYLLGRGVGGSSAVNSMVAFVGDHALYESWGWTDTTSLAERILVPRELPSPSELGRIDRLLLQASPDAALLPLTRRRGRRVTAAEAYLWPCLSSDRLNVMTDEVVDVVTFTGARRAASGVRLASGSTVSADAVVVAAGAIHTPALLLRSKVDAPGVGENLQDHPAAALTLRLLDKATGATKFERDREPNDAAGGVGGLCTATTIDADPIQILAFNHLGPAAPDDLAMLMVALMRPTGPGGRVRLRSDDPTDPPIVEFDLLSDPHDLDRLRIGVRSAIELLRRPPFSAVVDEVFIDDRGATVDQIDDDQHLDRWLQATAADYVHASCSCSRSVEPGGRVRGHEALFVCDASAFPSIPNVNTHVPTMMLAERFSALWIGST
jgi:choline dehydrogenase-like flavoprotein